MATGIATREPPPPPVQAAGRGRAVAGYDGFVEQQLRKTRTQVKLVDIAANSALLIAGALGFMLLVALIDHWIFELGFWTRLLALAVLVGGCGWFFVVRILPLIIRRINPVYAAYTIEQAEPSLKNSLINFLLLRGRREQVHEVVYQALGQRAASDLAHVPADGIVDYTNLIRIGYVLAALLALGAAYKILSPKDPLQSVARIVAPWAQIERPSRVQIEEVKPGDTNIFQGEHVTVSAIVRGNRKGDPVRVLFSSIDGQVIDQEVAMQLDSAGLRHTAVIPPGNRGVQSTLQYKLLAGDAETRWHNIEVVPAPHILVTKVRYEPPRYVGDEPQESTRGDLHGLEGTRVTIFAHANRQIESASVEFDPVLEPSPDAASAGKPSPAGDAKPAPASESLKISTINGQDVEISFSLRLAEDRKSPWHNHYALRFVTKDGHRNTQPVVHTISVKPDLAPLVEILTPLERDVEVPQNRPMNIEVRAVDPDYALSKVRLVAVKGTADVFDIPLLEAPGGRAGQVIQKFEFVPASFGLNAGDEIEYWAIAEDNRTNAKTGEPQPNVTRSRPNYRITITAPQRETPKASAEEPSDDDLNPPMDGGEGAAGDVPNDAPQQGANSVRNGGEKNQPKNSDPSGGESGASGNAGGTGGNSNSQASKNPSDDASEGSEGAEGSGSNSSQNSGNSEGAEGGDDSGDDNSQNSSGERGSKTNGGNSASSGNESGGQPNSGESGSKSGGNAAGAEQGGDNQSGENQTGDQAASGGGQRGGQKSQGGESGDAQLSDEPLENDGSRDGDVFDRTIDQVLRQLEKNRQKEGADGSPNAQPNSGNAEKPQGDESPQGGEQDGQPSQGETGSKNGSPQDGSQSASNTGEKNGNPQQGGSASQGSPSGEKNQGQPMGNPSGGEQGSAQNQADKQPNSGGAEGDQGAAKALETLEKLRKLLGGSESGQQSGDQSGGQQQGEKSPSGQDGSQQQGGGGQQQQGEKPKSGGSQSQQSPSGGGSQQGEKQQPQSGGSGEQGGQPQGGQKPEQSQQSGGGSQQQQSGGGQGDNDKSGAGQKSDGGGSPMSQSENPQQRNQNKSGGQQSGGGGQKEEGGKSPAGSKQGSQSQGDSAGDRKGGGQQGGGQGAQKPGNDSAGGGSAGDQGDGAANEPGSGQTGNQAGGSQVADHPTGRSGEQTGEGSSSGTAESGDERQQQPKSGSSGGGQSNSGKQPGGGKPQEGQSADGSGEKPTGTPGHGRSVPTGGGEPSDNPSTGEPFHGVDPAGDKANVEFARKATDLVLDYLKNQKDNPDRELLEKLGWSKEQLNEFVTRWERMQAAAKAAGDGSDEARRLDDSLRSLGLRAPGDKLRTGETGASRLPNQRDAGARSRPPKDYAEQYRAYTKSLTP